MALVLHTGLKACRVTLDDRIACFQILAETVGKLLADLLMVALDLSCLHDGQRFYDQRIAHPLNPSRIIRIASARVYGFVSPLRCWAC